VVAESATLRKRKVDSGRGVRITKTVTEREQIVDERLEQDELLVERVTVNQVVDSENLPTVRQEGDVTIVPVLEEIVVIEKRTLLKEELRITRLRREINKPQRVMLRSEEVTAEKFDENGAGAEPAPTRPTESTAGKSAGET
jgi:stress response protein YsnF